MFKGTYVRFSFGTLPLSQLFLFRNYSSVITLSRFYFQCLSVCILVLLLHFLHESNFVPCVGEYVGEFRGRYSPVYSQCSTWPLLLTLLPFSGEYQTDFHVKSKESSKTPLFSMVMQESCERESVLFVCRIGDLNGVLWVL